MTRYEKKDTQSEISPINCPDFEGKSLDVNMDIRYMLLHGEHVDGYQIPMDGFLHIILVEGCRSGDYILDNQSYTINCCENAIHPVDKSSTLEWKNLAKETIAVLLFTAKEPVSQLLDHFGYKDDQLRQGLISTNSQQLSLIVQRLHTVSASSDPLRSLRLQILALEALLSQLNEHNKAQHQENARTRSLDYYAKMQEVKRLIEKDLSRSYTISELAKEVGTNEQYIKKYFKQYFGKTVMNYVTSTKMEYAKRLIMTSEYRIADVAQMIGYKHSTHFTTAFKKYFGFIPNSLRY